MPPPAIAGAGGVMFSGCPVLVNVMSEEHFEGISLKYALGPKDELKSKVTMTD